MPYSDLLRMTGLLAAGAATALAAIAVITADQEADSRTLLVCAVWWPAALAIGFVLGRPGRAADGVAPALAAARTTPSLPTDQPGRVAVARLWPLVAFACIGGGLGFLWPGVPAIGTGFALAAALAIRAREGAVTGIEDRDGVRFYVEPGSTFEPVRLVRTPGLRRDRPPPAKPPPPPAEPA
ncbi:MAG: hypothetical protein ACRDKH_06955 [Solirubrobacterales bacterium]